MLQSDLGLANDMITNSSFSSVSQQYPTLIHLLDDRAQKQADKIAYIFLNNGETESATLTYQQLQQQARAIAAQLQQKLSPGERALLLYPSGLEFIVAFFGCLYADIIAVPAYPPRRNQNLSRLQSIISDCQAKIALTTQTLLPNLESRLEQDPQFAPLHWLATDSVDLASLSDWIDPQSSSETLAFLQYTSGSTGKPKGVMVTQGNLIHNQRTIERGFGHTDQTIFVGWLPLFHDMGLIGNVLQPLYLGIPCTLMAPVDFLQKPVRWLQAISRYRATTSGGPNFAYDLCMRKVTEEQKATLDLSSWEVAFNGAEPIRSKTLERFAEAFARCGFRHKSFYPCYGMAEATLFVSGNPKQQPPTIDTFSEEALTGNRAINMTPNQEGAKQIVGVGHGWLDQQIRIVDPHSFTECSPARVGEIWLAGKSVAHGYWNNPEKSAETFQAYIADNSQEEPFLRTGDLGFFCEDGELFITGRLKDVIIIRGRNHYPQDIESTIENSHEALIPNHSAAFCLEVDGEEKLIITAEVERRYRHRRRPKETQKQFEERERRIRERRKENVNPGFELSLDSPPVFEEILANIRKNVAKNHGLQVHALCLLRFGSIPKTSSGKIQRYACRQGFLGNTLNVVWQSK